MSPGKAVIVWGMPGLSVCCLPRPPEGPATGLPGASFHCPHTQSSVKTHRRPWAFRWQVGLPVIYFHLVALELRVLFIKGILLFYKATWGIKDKWVPLARFPWDIYLHILKNVHTQCLYAHIYLSSYRKWKGEANLYPHFTPQADCRFLRKVKRQASLLLLNERGN